MQDICDVDPWPINSRPRSVPLKIRIRFFSWYSALYRDPKIKKVKSLLGNLEFLLHSQNIVHGVLILALKKEGP